jgi:multidrug efflux pump subunit AcrB
MKKMQRLIALTTVMALLAGQVQGQPDGVYYEDTGAAYDNGQSASYMSVWLPIGALAIAAVLIATTNRGHHHGSGSGSATSGTSVHFHSSSVGSSF